MEWVYSQQKVNIKEKYQQEKKANYKKEMEANDKVP